MCWCRDGTDGISGAIIMDWLRGVLLCMCIGVSGNSLEAAAPVDVQLKNDQAVVRITLAGGGITEFRLIDSRLNPLNWTIEGLELREPASWMLAVQWHPELTAEEDPRQQALFNRLVEAASGQQVIEGG